MVAMRITILDKYIAMRYLQTLVIVFLAVAMVLLIFDFIELARIASTKNVAVKMIFLMTLQKVPLHMQKIVGFLIMIAAMLTFMRAARDNEIIIMRVMGISTARSLLSIGVITLILGAFNIGAINPLTALVMEAYERNEAKYFRGNSSTISVSKSGIWMKSSHGDEQIIMHAMKIIPDQQALRNVTFFYFNAQSEFIRRYDAKIAHYVHGVWHLGAVNASGRETFNAELAEVMLPIEFSFAQIEDNLVAPDSVSFWKLPSFIAMTEDHGLSVKRHQLHFYKLLIFPVFSTALALIGVAFAKRNLRFDSIYINVFYCLGVGFGIYVLTDMIGAFAIAGDISVLMGAFVPSALSWVAAVGLFLNRKVI
jgi:lipopolysaccharide export system permease protein